MCVHFRYGSSVSSPGAFPGSWLHLLLYLHRCVPSASRLHIIRMAFYSIPATSLAHALPSACPVSLLRHSIHSSSPSSTGQVSAPIRHLSIWQKPVFLLNSRLGLFTAAPSRGRPLFRSYGTNLPSSLTTLLPLALEFSSCLPVSVCGTGASDIPESFSRPRLRILPYSIFGPFRPGQPSPGLCAFKVSLPLNLLAATDFPPYVHRLRLSASP